VIQVKSDPGVVTDNAVEGVILEPREIARRYISSWFALDLVSSLPVDYIIVLVSPDTGVTHLVHAGPYHYESTNRPPHEILHYHQNRSNNANNNKW